MNAIRRLSGFNLRISAVLLAIGWTHYAGAEGLVTQRWGVPPTVTPGGGGRRPPPPVAYATAAPEEPRLDGKMSDEVWALAQRLELSRTLDGSSRAAQPTEVRVLRSADNRRLFLAFVCGEANLEKLKATPGGQDAAVWEDDSIEFFIGSKQSGTYYHYGFNALGSRYDGAEKNGKWNGSWKVATARTEEAWTAEVELPLGEMEQPGETWIANFNRNRYAGGRLHETAWSPTYSGSSHDHDQYGTLHLKDPPAQAAEATGARSGASFISVQGGAGVVRFDLSEIPAGARIRRAALRIFRTQVLAGADPEAGEEIEIYPLFEAVAEGGAPKAEGPPLALVAPWFDRFDVTETVRSWAAGKANGGFFVKTCPLWNKEATVLEVAWEGEADKVPPQATGVKVVHRAGQSFITWQEIEDVAGRDDLRWKDLRALLSAVDGKREVRYVVYRSARPITRATLGEALPLAEVAPLSCWNVNGRSIERAIDEVIANRYALFHGHWNPFGGAQIDGEWGGDCPMDRLVIEDGAEPLARATGLYVHTAAGEGPAYYAVVTKVDGVENTKEFSAANAIAEPVAEKPGEPEPVFQRDLPKQPFFNYDEARKHYVRWVGPPYANLPCRYFNWMIAVPEKLEKPAALELHLHRDGRSYWRTPYRIEKESIVVVPHDFPVKSWWYGYHESMGTLRSFKTGTAHNYTERRILSMLKWIRNRYEIDPNRMLLTAVRRTSGSHHAGGDGSGSTGALLLALRNPELFNGVYVGYARVDLESEMAEACRSGTEGETGREWQGLWGRYEWDLKTAGGARVWERLNGTKLVAALPAKTELPVITHTSKGVDPVLKEFYKVLLDKKQSVAADFGVYGGGKFLPVSHRSHLGRCLEWEIRRDLAMPVFRGPETRVLDTAPKEASGNLVRSDGTKRLWGEFNQRYRWRTETMKDEPARFEVQIAFWGKQDVAVTEVSLRRLQKFEVKPGARYAWKLVGLPDGAEPGTEEQVLQDGELTVPEDGVLSVPQVKIARSWRTLIVEAAK